MLVCIEPHCQKRYALTEVIYNCPACGGLLEVETKRPAQDSKTLKQLWRQRRLSNAALDQSGVWRYRELLPFEGHEHPVATLREGNTPLLPSTRAAEYGGLASLTFKHQGFNPTGSFKDNGMTCGATQARRLGLW